jgi:hypothetical protein
MNAKKCDRCGDFYINNTFDARSCTKEPITKLTFLDKYGNRGESFDLCDCCWVELVRFLNYKED